MEVEGDTIVLQCPSTATCFTGDGCAVNLKACRLMSENFGFQTPYIRCQAHTSDGSIIKAYGQK